MQRRGEGFECNETRMSIGMTEGRFCWGYK